MHNPFFVAALAMLASLPRLEAQDTIVVRADNPPVWGPNIRLVRELRIGQLEGAPEYTFGGINSVAAGPDGSIFVIDGQAATVRQYDVAGKHVRSFGRSGSGPGELQGPEAAAIVGNQLVVRDIRNRRFVVYPLNGGEPKHWNYPSYSASFRPLVVHADGGISTPFSFSRGNAGFQPAVLRYDPNGAIKDTLATPSFGPAAAMLTVATGGGRASYSIPYMPMPIWVFTTSSQFIGGTATRYSLVINDGRTIRQIDRTAPIRSANDPNYKWNGPEIPAVKPFYKELRVDSDDRIWVQLHGPSTRVDPTEAGQSVTYREPVIYDVISSAGRYLGQIRFPDGFTLHQVRGNQIWGTERGEFDVQYVVRYRAQIPAASPARR